MSTPFHNVVHVHGIKNEMFNRTMVFVIPNGLKKADVEGRLVEPDPTVDCGMKLLTDGTAITSAVGRLEVYEERGVATIQFRFSELVPILAADPLARGDVAVGAGNGFVKAGVADEKAPWVAEIITDKAGKKFASIVAI